MDFIEIFANILNFFVNLGEWVSNNDTFTITGLTIIIVVSLVLIPIVFRLAKFLVTFAVAIFLIVALTYGVNLWWNTDQNYPFTVSLDEILELIYEDPANSWEITRVSVNTSTGRVRNILERMRGQQVVDTPPDLDDIDFDQGLRVLADWSQNYEGEVFSFYVETIDDAFWYETVAVPGPNIEWSLNNVFSNYGHDLTAITFVHTHPTLGKEHYDIPPSFSDLLSGDRADEILLYYKDILPRHLVVQPKIVWEYRSTGLIDYVLNMPEKEMDDFSDKLDHVTNNLEPIYLCDLLEVFHPSMVNKPCDEITFEERASAINELFVFYNSLPNVEIWSWPLE